MTLNHSGVMEIIFYFHNFIYEQSKCPVPREQQPTNEFIELSNLKFFLGQKQKSH